MDTTNLTKWVNELQGQIDVVKNKTAALPGDIEDLEGDIEDLEGDVTTLQTAVETLQTAIAGIKKPKAYIGRSTFMKSGNKIIGFEISVDGEFTSTATSHYYTDFNVVYDISEDEYYSICGVISNSGSNYIPIYHYIYVSGQGATVTEYAIAKVTFNVMTNQASLSIRSEGSDFGFDSGGNPPNIWFSIREVEYEVIPEPESTENIKTTKTTTKKGAKK